MPQQASRSPHATPLVGRAAPQRRWKVLALVLTAMLVGAATIAFSPADTLVQDFALIDHIGAYCMLAIAAMLSPLHRVFEILCVAGVVFASLDRLRVWRHARMLLQAVEPCTVLPDSGVAAAARDAGVDERRIFTLNESPVPAFTLGAITPNIYLSSRLEQILSHDELVAVLAHEGEHLRRRDPFRLSLVRFLSRSLFWLPAVRALETHLAEEAEHRADAAAARRSGIATASALLVLVRHFRRAPMPALSTGLSHHEFIALRVRLLTGANALTHSTVSARSLITTMSAVLLLWIAAFAELHNSTHSAHVAADHGECVVAAEHPIDKLRCVDVAHELATPIVTRTPER